MRWLGIETSCDETSIALVENGENIIVNLIASQVELHRKFGGVVPEIASRKHLEVLNPLLAHALKTAGVAWNELDGIGVSMGPGLVGSLLMGVAAAKVIAGTLSIPLLGINHLDGHIYSNFLTHPGIELPCVCLLVSGGHTALILMHDHGKLELLGETRDDAAGECFDKAARILGLPYPGGPQIDLHAREGNPRAINFPRVQLSADSLEFSFSGLKTSIMYFVKSGNEFNLPDICASFQAAVVDVLVSKSISAMKKAQINRLLLAGGVACNSHLREDLLRKSRELGFELHYPPPVLCTDNAAMIACAAHYYHKRGISHSLELDARPNLPLGFTTETNIK